MLQKNFAKLSFAKKQGFAHLQYRALKRTKAYNSIRFRVKTEIGVPEFNSETGSALGQE